MKSVLTGILLYVTILITGCASTPTVVDTDVCYDKPPLILEEQKPLRLEALTGRIIRLDDGSTGVVFSGNDFRKWILNNKSIENYIRIDRSTIDAYSQYYSKQKEVDAQPVKRRNLTGK